MENHEYFIEKLKANASKLTGSDKKIANIIIKSYPQSLLLSASELSDKSGVNISTVSRFFNKIGYKRSKDIQKEFHEQLEFIMNSPLDRYHQSMKLSCEKTQLFKDMLSLDLENISITIKNVKPELINELANSLRDEHKNIFIIGERKQYSLAFYLYNQLNTLRRSVFLVNQSNGPDHLSGFGKGDIAIIFDFRRYPSFNVRAADFVSKQEGIIVGIVDSPGSPVFKRAKYAFIVSTKNITAFDSYTAAISLINIIVGSTVSMFDDNFEKRFKKMQDAYKHLGVFHYEKNV